MSATTVAGIRAQRRNARIAGLREAIQPLLGDPDREEVWLFGSWARGDWDAYSDVDLLAIAPDQEGAEALADALRARGLADDVIALTQEEWVRRRQGEDPWWRGIGRDAIRLAGDAAP
jgi:predicted nucleotidyltransferase